MKIVRKISGFLLLALIVRFAAAEDRFDTYFAPGNSAAYSLAVEPATGGSPSIVTQGIKGSMEVAKEEQKTWTATGRAAHTHIDQSLVMPGTGLVFPDSLSDVAGGLNFLNKTGDRRQWGANFSVGSASDKLFHSIHETEVQATGSVMVPSGPRNAWLFLLSYSNNRSFLNNIPLPGAAYIWSNPERGFRAVLGFPFLMLTYRPNPIWSGKLTVTGSTNQSLEVARQLAGAAQAYVLYERLPQQWMRAGRQDTSHRLIYDEKKILLGVRCPISKILSVDISGGRTFDRRLFEARDASRDGAKIHLDRAWLIGAKLSTHF